MTNLNISIFLKNDYMHGSSKTWLLQNYHSTLKHYDLLEIHKATIAISLINIMIIIKSSFKNKTTFNLELNFVTGMLLQFNPREHPRPWQRLRNTASRFSSSNFLHSKTFKQKLEYYPMKHLIFNNYRMRLSTIWIIINHEVCRYQAKAKAEVDNGKLRPW